MTFKPEIYSKLVSHKIAKFRIPYNVLVRLIRFLQCIIHSMIIASSVHIHAQKIPFFILSMILYTYLSSKFPFISKRDCV